MQNLQKIADRLEVFLRVLGLLCFGGMVLVVLLQVATRLWLPWPVSWTEEFSRFFFLYCIAFCAPVALKNRELVFVDMLVLNLPAKAQAVFLIVGDILISVLCIVICIQAVPYTQLGVGQTAPASGWPMTVFYASMIILSLFLSLFSLINWIRHIPFILKGGGK